MGSKILRKIAMQLQSGASYEATSMTLMAFTDGIINQSFDAIEDDGIIGEGFNNTPLQGLRHVAGSYSFNIDNIGIENLLAASLGGIAGTVFTFNGSHDTKLSIAELNAVNCIKYASAYVKSLKMSGSKGGLLKVDTDLFGVVAQDRGVVGNFPTPTLTALVPYSFQELGGASGYVRIGDQANALNSGDDVKIESFNVDIITGFDESFANENEQSTPDALGSLTPKWGMVQPSVKFSMKIPRYLTEQYQTWQDANTALQIELYAYKSATKTMKIQLPNVIIKSSLESGELTTIGIEASVGRNGVGASYVNSYMAFNSPIKVTLTNS